MTFATTALHSIDSITTIFWDNIQIIMPEANIHTLGKNQAEIIEWMKDKNSVTLYPILSGSFLNTLSPVSPSMPSIPTSEPITIDKATISTPRSPEDLKHILGHTFLTVPSLHSLRPLVAEMHKEHTAAINSILSSMKKEPNLSNYPTCTNQLLPNMPEGTKILFRLTSNGQPITDMQAVTSLIMSGHNLPSLPIDIISTEKDYPPIRLGFDRKEKASAEDNHRKLVLSSALILFFLSVNNVSTTVENNGKKAKITNLSHNKKPNYIEKIDKITGLNSAEKNLTTFRTNSGEENSFDLDLYFNNPYSEYIATARQAITDTICLVLSIIIQDTRTRKQNNIPDKAPENFGQSAFHHALMTLIADILTENSILPTCDYMTEPTSIQTNNDTLALETSVINNYTSHSISTYVRPSYENVGLLPDNLSFYALEDVA